MLMRPPTLRLIQAITVCVVQRKPEGAIQGLKMLLEMVDEDEAEKMVRLLANHLSPSDRYWFGTMNGARKGPLSSYKIKKA